MENHGTFATVLGCMDGRCQEKAIAYVKQQTHADHVDMITEPGIDKLLAGGAHAVVKSVFARRALRSYIRTKASISANGHGSTTCFVMGHCGCAGNPGDLAMHIEHLQAAKRRVESWGLFQTVRTVVFDENWNIREVA